MDETTVGRGEGDEVLLVLADGRPVRLRVLRVRAGCAVLGVDAPGDVRVRRQEVEDGAARVGPAGG